MRSKGFSKKFTIFVDMSSSRRSSRHLKEDSSVGKVVTPRTLDPVTALASLSGELKPAHVDFPFPNPSNYSLLSTPGPHSKLEIDAALKWYVTSSAQDILDEIMDLNTRTNDIPDLVDSLIELPSDDENTLLLKNMIFWKLQLVNKDQVIIRETEFWRQVNLKESSFASNLKREFSSMIISIVKGNTIDCFLSTDWEKMQKQKVGHKENDLEYHEETSECSAAAFAAAGKSVYTKKIERAIAAGKLLSLLYLDKQVTSILMLELLVDKSSKTDPLENTLLVLISVDVMRRVEKAALGTDSEFREILKPHPHHYRILSRTQKGVAQIYGRLLEIMDNSKKVCFEAVTDCTLVKMQKLLEKKKSYIWKSKMKWDEIEKKQAEKQEQSLLLVDIEEATKSLKKLRIFDESEEVQIFNELEVVDTEQKQLGPSNYWDDMSNTNGFDKRTDPVHQQQSKRKHKSSNQEGESKTNRQKKIFEIREPITLSPGHVLREDLIQKFILFITEDRTQL